MLGIGPWEIAIIAIIALLLIGPRRLPEVMKTVGKGIFELRKASSDFRRTLEHEVTAEERHDQDDRIMEERRKYMDELKAQQEVANQGATNGESPAADDGSAEAGSAKTGSAKTGSAETGSGGEESTG